MGQLLEREGEPGAGVGAGAVGVFPSCSISALMCTLPPGRLVVQQELLAKQAPGRAFVEVVAR